MMKKVLSILSVSLLLLMSAFPVMAHITPSTHMALDIGKTSVGVDMQLPVDQLVVAAPEVFKSPQSPMNGVQSKQLNTYLLHHTKTNIPANVLQQVTFGRAAIRDVDGVPFVVTSMSFHWAAEYKLGNFTLTSDAILHRVLSHKTYVSIRSDIYNGILAKDTKPLGVLRYKHEHIEVSRQSGSNWTAFVAMFTSGANHIAEGADHLMFLLCLLLPAPLLARAGKWDIPATLVSSTTAVIKIVTSFTLGHSVTLALVIFGLVKVPSQPIEVLVALSVLVSAFHAIKPVFACYTVFIAMGFGLVHGMAFAKEMLGLGFSLDAALMATFGFNLGIETVQLAIVLSVMPWLLLMAKTPFYRPIRIACAVMTGVAAIGWILQRVWLIDNPLDQLINLLMDHALLLYVLLVSISVTSMLANKIIAKRQTTSVTIAEEY